MLHIIGWEKRKLLRISHHESEAIFRIFRLCATTDRLVTLFFTQLCTLHLAWPRPFGQNFSKREP